ncbi:dehydrogenase/reductase SDR family member 4-like isoform X2 [Lonchura striata]
MVQEALAEFGAIDILVSNAAVNPHLGPALEADERTWDKVFQVNVTATAMLVRLVAPHMERRGGGAIVVMSSIAGYQPMAGLGPYSVSKTALLGLVSALSPELLPRGIRINGVAPGLIRTHFSAALWQDEATRDQALAALGAESPSQSLPVQTSITRQAGLPAGRGSGRAVPGLPPGRLRGRPDPAGGRGGAAPPLTTPSSSICKFMLIRREIKSILAVPIGIGGYWFGLGGAGRDWERSGHVYDHAHLINMQIYAN